MRLLITNNSNQFPAITLACSILLLCSGCLGSRSAKAYAPVQGIELSTRNGIHIKRLNDQDEAAQGSGSFSNNVLQAHNLDAVSLIDLVTPNCRIRVHTSAPIGRYVMSVDKDAFPAHNNIQQRLLI